MSTDEDKVKEKLVRLIEKATKVDEVVALANAFTKLRAVELKQDQDAFATELADAPEAPTELNVS
jgi:hypothetical protein